jgi:hypothetical protein
VRNIGTASLTIRHRTPADCFPQLESSSQCRALGQDAKGFLITVDIWEQHAILADNAKAKCFTIARLLVQRRAR